MKRLVAMEVHQALRVVGFACGVLMIITCCLVNQLDRQESIMSVTPGSGPHVDARQEDIEWPYPFIHILNTRFQQMQPTLQALGQARLKLFKTFCLNSILGQTALDGDYTVPPFLWIIKVDPNLTAPILHELVALVRDYEFVYVVGSNTNYGIGIHSGGWRGGQAGTDILNSRVYSGNMTFIRMAHAARERSAILETRIDADDGLNVQFIKSIQDEASLKLKLYDNESDARQQWMYWCALKRLDWSATPPEIEEPAGMFVPKKAAHMCMTSGITLGVSLQIPESSIPRFMHQELIHELRERADVVADCGAKETAKCLHLVTEPLLGAIRSRTPTSAGMRGVAADEGDFDESFSKNALTNMKLVKTILSSEFEIDFDQVINTNTYFRDNVIDIIADNLRGQCTHGHSCKLSTKEALQTLLDVRTNHSIGGVLLKPVKTT